MKVIECQRDQDSSDSSKIEEISRSDGTGEDFGHGQSYECMFCRRGFSTAQALGGHMNIHRRDRARMRQLSNDLQANCCPCRSMKDPIIDTEIFPQLCSNNQANCIPPPWKSSRNHHFYHELVPPISSSYKKPRTSDFLNLFNSQHLDHCRISDDDLLSLRLGKLAYDPCHRRFWIDEQRNHKQAEYVEMDLELRLGQYDPSLV